MCVCAMWVFCHFADFKRVFGEHHRTIAVAAEDLEAFLGDLQHKLIYPYL